MIPETGLLTKQKSSIGLSKISLEHCFVVDGTVAQISVGPSSIERT